jgi:hypothetical protein
VSWVNHHTQNLKMVCAHAPQGLVHHKNIHIIENKVYEAQQYTYT